MTRRDSKSSLRALRDRIDKRLHYGEDGHVEIKWIVGKNGQKYGPYAYLRVRRNGRLVSIYLGKVD